VLLVSAISLIGILAAVALLVIMAFKGFNIVFTSIIASIVICVFSGMNPLSVLKSSYLGAISVTGTFPAEDAKSLTTSVGGFVGLMRSYLLLFVLSGTFGKFMAQCGAVTTLANLFSKLTKLSKAPAHLTLCIMVVLYMILSYIGINGFVTVFTLMGIGNELFKKTNCPWELYPYGSSGIMAAALIPGSLYTSNVMANDGMGVGMAAAPLMSSLMCVVYLILIFIMARIDVARLAKRGEFYLPAGAAYDAAPSIATGNKEDLPSGICAIIPMLAPIVAIILKLDVLYALTLGILVCVIFNFNKFNGLGNMKKAVSEGFTVSMSAIANVAAMTGLVAVMRVSPGYRLIIDIFAQAPGVWGLLFTGMLTGAIVGSQSSFLPTMWPDAMIMADSLGMDYGVMSRLVIMSGTAYCTPHNSGNVNGITLAKLNFARGAMCYIRANFIPGIITLVIFTLLAQAGVFS
jgi:H+/gluconate symporter-like permease